MRLNAQTGSASFPGILFTLKTARATATMQVLGAMLGVLLLSVALFEQGSYGNTPKLVASEMCGHPTGSRRRHREVGTESWSHPPLGEALPIVTVVEELILIATPKSGSTAWCGFRFEVGKLP